VERFLPLLLTITVMKECERMRIGVLEDDPAIRGLLHETLEMCGHTPCIFRNGWDFLEQFLDEEAVLSRKPFDVVLIDLFLPSSISGKQTIHQLRTAYADLPIVIISAASCQHLERLEQEYPGVAVFRKPFVLRKLLAAIEAYQCSRS